MSTGNQLQRYDVIIVGGGQAGAQAAISLRQGGFPGTIAMIGDEPDAPYERPPLSKGYLAGDRPAERLLLRPVQFWQDRQIDLRLGREVIAVHPEWRQLLTAEGEIFEFGQLIWATGGRPRRLPALDGNLGGVHSIRTRLDVDHLRADLVSANSVVIVGGGYIGLEAAAILVRTGLKVTLVEAQDRVLARVAGRTVSRFFEEVHRREGVDLRLGRQVIGGDERSGRIAAIHLDDGSILPCGAAIVGIGIEPATAPLAAAGATISNGIDVDGFCRTSLPGIFAIGDCASHANDYAGGTRVRLESVQNAVDQAKTTAAAILGRPEPYRAVPWFWSSQYDLKLQTVGLNLGFDEEVVRGSPDARSFTVAYLKEGRVLAFDCVNRIRDFTQGRPLVTSRAPLPADWAAESVAA